MPRRTPVREIKEDENMADSPIRRSTRIAATTSTPSGTAQGAKVISRRNSASSDTGSQTAKITRRMSQDDNDVDTPKRSSRSGSKSPMTLLKEQNLKSTPTVTRTRRASRSGTDDESSQPTTSSASEPSRRMTRRSSFSEKTASLEKIEEVNSPQPQKRTTRRRSSSTDTNPLDKIVETTEEKRTNMETIAENVDEDRDVEKTQKQTIEIIAKMKTSPVVMVQRLKGSNVENESAIDDHKKNTHNENEGEKETSAEKEIMKKTEIPSKDENIVKISDTDKIEELKIVAKKGVVMEDSLVTSTDKHTEDADIEVSNLNLQITMNPEEEDNPNLNNSGSSDKENSTTNVPKTVLPELKEKSNIQSANVVTNTLTVSEDKTSKATSMDINTVADKIEKVVSSPTPKKRRSLENVSDTINANENVSKTTKLRKSMSPVFDLERNSEDEGTISKDPVENSNKNEVVTSKLKETVEHSIRSPQKISKLSNLDTKAKESKPQDNSVASDAKEMSSKPNEHSETNESLITNKRSLSLHQKDNVEKAVNINVNDEKQPINGKKLEGDESSKPENKLLITDEREITSMSLETSAVLNQTESIGNEKTVDDHKSVEIEIGDIEIEENVDIIDPNIETPKRDLLTEMKNFNDLINDETEELKEGEGANTTTMDDESTLELSDKSNTKEIDSLSESGGIDQKDNSTVKENNMEIDSKDESSPKKLQSAENSETNDRELINNPLEDIVPPSPKNKEDNPESIGELNEKPDGEKQLPRELNKYDNQEDSVNKLKTVEYKIAKQESEELFESESPNKDSIEQSKESETVDNIDKTKTPTKQESDDPPNKDSLEQSKETQKISDTEKTKTPNKRESNEPRNKDSIEQSKEIKKVSNIEKTKTSTEGESDEPPNKDSIEQSKDIEKVSNINKTKTPTEQDGDEPANEDSIEQSKETEKVSHIHKTKTPTKRESHDDDLLSSVIDESELDDINEFLSEVNTDDTEKSNIQKKRRSSLKPEVKESPKKVHDFKKQDSQESEDLNKSNEKRRSLKTSDDQSENSIREKIDNILKNKALDTDSEETDEEEDEDNNCRNEFVDDMAEEVDEEEDDVFEDSNEIPCEGESINSSDTESEYEEESYENNSFIDDEENNELLSGSEEFLGDKLSKKKGKGKKGQQPKPKKDNDKKYTRIISLDLSGSDDEDPSPDTIIVDDDDGKENTGETNKTKRNQNEHIEVISVEEEQAPIISNPTICVDSDSEDLVVNIKTDPSDVRNSLDGSNRSSIRKSSITIQENISLQDIEDGDLSERITKVVEWFCSGIKTNNEMSKNISLNVSIDYNDSEDTAVETKAAKRKSMTPATENQASPAKIKKTTAETETLSEVVQHYEETPATAEMYEESTVTPSKEHQIRTATSGKKKKSKETWKSNEENNAVEEISSVETKENEKRRKSRKSLETTNDDFTISVQCEEISPKKIQEPSPNRKEKSRRSLETIDNEFIVEVVKTSPKKIKLDTSSKKNILETENSEVTTSSSSTKKNKSRKSANLGDFNVSVEKEDIELFSLSPTIASSDKMKKRHKIAEAVTESSDKEDTDRDQKIEWIDMSQPSTSGLGKNKKKSPNVAGKAVVGEKEKRKKFTIIKEDNDNISERKSTTIGETKRKSKTKEEKKLSRGKKNIEMPEEQEVKVTKGRKRPISDSTAQVEINDDVNVKSIPRKQKKVLGTKLQPTYITQFNMKPLGDWSNSPAQVSASLSEIPREIQRKVYTKIKTRSQRKPLITPSLNIDNNAWISETVTADIIGVSKHMKVNKKKRDAGSSKVPSFHPKDFKNQMLHCMGRVDRMDTKILLRNKKTV